ncbi:MAG TPA: amidohydrolase family protein [Crenalkalicoccus sp.]|jgi:aminocarboxymuconate-semialdehyde decarboxylase|nr:amidohydrolase family protein [Crenalkalicoccus sp.]
MRVFGCACHAGAPRRALLRAGFAAAALPLAGALRAQPAVRAVDIHAHFFPQEFLDLVAAEGGRFGAAYQRRPEGFTIGVADVAPPTAVLPTKFVELDERLRDMDAQGVAVQALSLTSPMIYWADAVYGAKLARAWNDAASAAHRAHPERFVGLAILPMQDTDAALAELERARALPGIRGVYCGTNIATKDLDEKRLLPVFKAIEAAGLPLFLHPLQTAGGARLQPFYLSNLLGNPLDSAIAAGHLIFGGVLDACPALQVNLPHAGGVLPILVGRWDHGTRLRPELAHMKGRVPSDYLRRFTYDTIAHDARIMRFVLELVGADRVMLGSDYCYDMGYDRPVQFVDTLGLDPETRAAILGGNAARVLKL